MKEKNLKLYDAHSIIDHYDKTDNVAFMWIIDHSRTLAIRILSSMPKIDVERTLAYFNTKGGYCDCEILLNVDPD
jgi:hypothetical protein